VQTEHATEAKTAPARGGMALARDCAAAWWRGEALPDDAVAAFAKFRERLRSWWQGTEPSVQPPAADTDAATQPADSGREPKSFRWTDPYIDLAERLWGPGHIGPGGDAFNFKMISPLGLDPAMTVMDFAAGLGGLARLMAKEFGVYVEGREASTELADAARARSVLAGLGRKAGVMPIDPDNAEFRPNRFDRIVAREVFHHVTDKKKLLKSLSLSMKKRGQLMLTDFLLAKTGEIGPEVEAWMTNEHKPSHPWSIDEFKAAASELQFQIFINEDLSDDYQRMILEGWSRFQEAIKVDPLPADLLPLTWPEAERWARCAAALKSGGLRYYRIIGATHISHD
jgi:ubiquinone/menaquinone biosynthesis C-methylase UbiE